MAYRSASVSIASESGTGSHDATALQTELLDGLDTFRKDVKLILSLDIRELRYREVLTSLDNAACQLQRALRPPSDCSGGVKLSGIDLDYQCAVITGSKRLLANARTLLSHVHELISEPICLP
jgi:hypothetical protein